MPDVEAAAEQGRTAASEPRAEGVLGRTYRMLTLGIVTVVLLIAFEAMAVGTAMPAAARDLHGVGLYAYAFSAYFTTALAAMVISGQWSDRSGPLRPLAAGIASFAVGLVLAGSAQSMWVFIAGRAVQGLGGGLVIVALYVVVSRAYPERLRPSILAAFAASWVVPSVVGPLAAGTVTEHLGWRWVFLGIPPLVLLPVLVALPAIRRRAAGPVDPDRVPALDRRRIGLAGAIAVGAGLLQYAGQDVRWLSAVPAVAGAALLVPAVRGLLPRGTYAAARGLPTVVLMRGIAAGSFIAAESFVPLMLVTQRGLSVTAAGMALAVGGATWALGSWTQARPRLERYRESLVRTGMLLTATAIASAALVLNESVPVWLIGLAWAVGCYGMGMVISGTSVLLLKLSAPEEAGTNSAALQLSDSLANVVLLAVAGVVFAALGGAKVGHGSVDAGSAGSHPGAFVAVFLPMAGVALVGAAVAGRLRPAVPR
ncbi:MFS transporter [Streptomyces sp. A7024]|uniref:MFS transporter n=1 Tax=Streptomyces coryli TaxID=1128680 RepID=A0A6G4U3H4_9ACTN|nr:MFS transporter [Streptomyces coryli]NGN66300.1 MFS transporter [Streptomyces coryli]